MSAPAPPVATSRAPAASSQPPAAPSRPSAATSRPPVASSRPPVASSRPLAATTPAVTTPAAATPAPTILEPTIPLTTRSSASLRPRTSTSTSPPTSTVTPYDASSDRRATTQRTNKILAGIFSTMGLIFLGLVLFQLYRRHKRRRKNTIPLPPPRKQSMSQVGYRNSRMVSMYGDYPTQDFSRPPSVLVHMDKSFGSRSAFAVTPSIHSNAASTDVLGTEEVVKKNAELLARPGHVAQESSSDNSISGPAMPLNDEEAGRQLSPLGSRSQSPTNGAPSRPASQLYAYPRPESRTRLARPSSVASTSRQSYLNTGSRQHGSQRHSSYGAANRNSYYATGNYGAPHSPHVRDRVGLVMPQPLAPELFNYALVGRHDMGLDFMQGAWGSQGSLAQASSDHNLAPPRRARTDSWVARGQHTPRSESPLASAKPLSAPEDGSEPRGRSAHPEVPRP